MRITDVPLEATFDLRRSVLRDGRADADVGYPEDDLPETFHLAVEDGAGRVVAVSTWAPVGTPRRPDVVAWRLRGMAVDPAVQGSGVGSRLLAEAVARLRATGVAALWADGRDTALPFYERHGWRVEGDGYLSGPEIPHHTVVLDLTDARG